MISCLVVPEKILSLMKSDYNTSSNFFLVLHFWKDLRSFSKIELNS